MYEKGFENTKNYQDIEVCRRVRQDMRKNMLLQTIKGKIFGQKQKKFSKNVQDQKTLYTLLRNL